MNCGTIRGIVPQEKDALQERAPLWNPLPKSPLFGLEQYFGSPNGDNENWNAFLVVKKCEYRFPVQMRGFAPSIPTSPFLKGLTPKSMNLFQEKVSADAGVLAVFETRKGIEKMPVAPTGKSKLHVFPLHRAKENYFTFLFRTS